MADFIFFVSYYILKYRRDVVWKNLSGAFPEKDEKELRKIERKFFHNLADTSVETLKLLTISEENLLRRVKINDPITEEYQSKGYATFGMTPHFCNWEWMLVASTNVLKLDIHAVYQRLREPFFDKLMIKIRSRLGVVLHEKNQVVQDILKMKGKSYLMSMVADQRPFSGENKYWSVFMNQDAAFYSGSELLARRMDIKVIYASMHRLSRGYYEVTFEELESNPRETKPNEITEKFIRRMEQDIYKDPSSYLWSHDRWKHKKPTE